MGQNQLCDSFYLPDMSQTAQNVREKYVTLPVMSGKTKYLKVGIIYARPMRPDLPYTILVTIHFEFHQPIKRQRQEIIIGMVH